MLCPLNCLESTFPSGQPAGPAGKAVMSSAPRSPFRVQGWLGANRMSPLHSSLAECGSNQGTQARGGPAEWEAAVFGDRQDNVRLFTVLPRTWCCPKTPTNGLKQDTFFLAQQSKPEKFKAGGASCCQGPSCFCPILSPRNAALTHGT